LSLFESNQAGRHFLALASSPFFLPFHQPLNTRCYTDTHSNIIIILFLPQPACLLLCSQNRLCRRPGQGSDPSKGVKNDAAFFCFGFVPFHLVSTIRNGAIVVRPLPTALGWVLLHCACWVPACASSRSGFPFQLCYGS
jgi:hypothetical protein